MMSGKSNKEEHHYGPQHSDYRYVMDCLVNNNADGIIIVDTNGIIRFVNPAATTLFGRSSNEIIGSAFGFPVVTNENAEISIVRPDGSVISVEMRSAESELKGEQAYLTSLRDISERRRLEQIREDVERLIRHDLKSPLQGVIGLSGMLMDDEEDPDKVMMLEAIHVSGNKLLSLINSSQDIFKMEEGLFTLEPATCNLIAILDQVHKEIKSYSTTKGLRFIIDNRAYNMTEYKLDNSEKSDKSNNNRPSEHYTIQGVDYLLETLFSNLLRNALEAHPFTADSPITLKLDSVNDKYTITIHNEGVVPEELRPRFFEKYVTSKTLQSAGLGTYSARLIARAHGGDITFSSSPAEGTTLTVVLPKS